jgi:hypothetical protein
VSQHHLDLQCLQCQFLLLHQVLHCLTPSINRWKQIYGRHVWATVVTDRWKLPLSPPRALHPSYIHILLLAMTYITKQGSANARQPAVNTLLVLLLRLNVGTWILASLPLNLTTHGQIRRRIVW